MTRIRPLPELTKYREDLGLSRGKLAESMGVSAVTIWRWETGERRPARKYVPKVAEMTGIPAVELMGVG